MVLDQKSYKFFLSFKVLNLMKYVFSLGYIRAVIPLISKLEHIQKICVRLPNSTLLKTPQTKFELSRPKDLEGEVKTTWLR